jgi:ferrous iron transport protein A
MIRCKFLSNRWPLSETIPPVNTLDQLALNQSAEITDIVGPPALTQRLMEFGLLEGESVTLIAKAPLGDPIEILIGGTRLSLRKTEAMAVRLAPRNPSS